MVPKSAVGSVVVFRIIHYSLVAITAIILAWFTPWIQETFKTGKHFGGDLEWVNRIWCGLLFLLAYAIVRVILYLLEVLGIEEESEFPDIERPWRKAVIELAEEGLPIDELPLFVINGLTPQQEQSVFLEAAGIDWQVVSPPQNDTGSALRVYAYSEAIYVSCSGVGAVNCQQGKVVEVTDGGTPVKRAAPANVGNQTIVASEISQVIADAKAGTGTVSSKTMAAPQPPPAAPPKPGGTLKSIGAALAKATMSPGSIKQGMKSFTGVSQKKGYGKKQVAPIDAIETETARKRMGFLCSLIKESRYPYCPINGLLQAIPISWATTADYAKKLAPAIRCDLETIRESLQLQFPVVAVYSELDSVPGLKEFLIRLERIQPGIGQSRAGSRFATGARIDESSVDWLLDRSMNWFRGWTYTAFASDINHKHNLKMFHLLCVIRERRRAMAVLLRESFYQLSDPETRLTGCYFFATGEGATEQGFIRGVLDRMVETEGEVAWSPELVTSVSRTKYYSTLLIAGSLLLGAINGFLIWQLLDKK